MLFENFYFSPLNPIRILDARPKLVNSNHSSVSTALQVAIANRSPANVDLIPLQSTASLSYQGAVCRSTPLHYACLLGDMKIVEVLLRRGAEWAMFDGNELLPENYAGLNGDRKMKEFKDLCEVQMSKRREEEELRWAGRFTEELEFEREAEKRELQRIKEREVQEELAKTKKLGTEELRRVKRFAEELKLKREEEERELERLKNREVQEELSRA